MIRINLLPHREQKRKARTRQFALLSGLFFGVGLSVVIAIYLALSTQVSTQDRRNEYLTEENTKLDKQIAQIETLKQERQLLLDRTKIVARLQSNRSETVKMLDQLVRQVPEGIYFTEIRQANDTVRLTGVAQSQARVSTLMRSLNDSLVFEQPNLEVIRSVQIGTLKLNQFVLQIKLTREQEGDDKNGPSGKAQGAS